MIKYALLSFQFFGILILGLFSENGIMVDNQAPETLAPGEKREVTITINKSTIQGFGKLEILLPSGLTASSGRTEGASFTFHDQKARFVWMTMPTEASFRITYILECTAPEGSSLDIKGAFSYIEQNKRIDYSLPLRTVAVNQGDVQMSAPTADTTSLVSETGADQPRSASSMNLLQASELRCTRTIRQLNATDFEVTLRITGNTIQGFAKILETVPNTCKTEKILDAGAVVTQEKNIIKFVWFEIPKSDVVEVSYKVSCLTAQTSLPVISGKLSYVENSAPKEMVILTYGDSPAALVAETPTPVEAPVTPKETERVAVQEPVRTEPEKKQEVIKDPVREERTSSTEKQRTEQEIASRQTTKEEAITSVPSPEVGITYKVQLLAAHRVVNKTYFKQQHGYNGQFNIENHEGWVKYTTGRFDEYRQARDAREEITRSHVTLPGPFVTAYNDGQRITVQEALLISGQKWYK